MSAYGKSCREDGHSFRQRCANNRREQVQQKRLA
jgi:hypothetical protein